MPILADALPVDPTRGNPRTHTELGPVRRISVATTPALKYFDTRVATRQIVLNSLAIALEHTDSN